LQLIAERPELAEPVPGAAGYLLAEARYAVTHEGARTLDDVLSRRTRIAIEEPDQGVAAATAVAELVAPLLQWNEQRIHNEIDRFHHVAGDSAAACC
ncbi:MAG: glycerol-3-phosphate dehydrogenase C-terminal domain-containing protein, partial [Thermocrispum sp.]